MKVNLNVDIVDPLSGKVMRATDNAGKPVLGENDQPKPLTVKHAVAQCLLHPARAVGGPEEVHAASKLAQRLLKDEGESELSISDINTIRVNAAASWPPLVAGAIFDLFDQS